MSYESSGFPLTVRSPDTTQLLEPGMRSGRGEMERDEAGWIAATLLSGPSISSSSSSPPSDLDFGWIWSSIRRLLDEGGRSRQELLTKRSSVSSGPSLARISSRMSALL